MPAIIAQGEAVDQGAIFREQFDDVAESCRDDVEDRAGQGPAGTSCSRDATLDASRSYDLA